MASASFCFRIVFYYTMYGHVCEVRPSDGVVRRAAARGKIMASLLNVSTFSVVGLFFIIPCIDSFIKVDLRTISFDVPPQEVSN